MSQSLQSVEMIGGCVRELKSPSQFYRCIVRCLCSAFVSCSSPVNRVDVDDQMSIRAQHFFFVRFSIGDHIPSS